MPGIWAPAGASGTTIAGGDVAGAAHDPRLPAAEVDVDQREPVGVRMRDDVEHLGRDDAADLAPGLLDRLDLEAELVERGHELVDRRLGRA